MVQAKFLLCVLCITVLSANIEAVTVYLCDGSSKRITCPTGQVIRVDEASYGRQDATTCRAQGNTGSVACRSSNSQSVVKRWCDRRPSCTIVADVRYFGDPCAGVSKYLNMTYTCVKNDPCTSYIEEDNYQRSTAFKAIGQGFACDRRLIAGWYRFVSKAGGEIPTTCPGPNSCGSQGAVWLNGANPIKVGEVKDIPACVSTLGNCCASNQKWNVKVKMCAKGTEQFFVYYLTPVPGCPMAYCAGNHKKCPPGTNSKSGFEPGCTTQFPRVTAKPRLTTGIKEKRIELRCEFTSPDIDTEDVFEVTWFKGASALQFGSPQVIRGSKRVATVRNTNQFGQAPLFKLGNTFSCRVRAWFARTPNLTSPIYESNLFYAGIKVYPRQIKVHLRENQTPISLYVEATVPVVCQRSSRCAVLVELGQTSKQNFLDYCGLLFKDSDVNRTKKVDVVAKRDFVDDGNSMMLLKFHIPEVIDPVDWNEHEKIPDIQVISVDVPTARCTSTGDPHILTFDKVAFNHYAVGDYVLVKSRCRKFEVHVRTWKCSSVSCNCGVAAMEGDDVIVVDMCKDRIPRAWFASTVKPREGTNLRRSNDGKSFLISFPSGSFVRFDVHRWVGNAYYANIVVQVPSDDFECTRGICGLFDKDRSNDMLSKDERIFTKLGSSRVAPSAFTESWKLPVGTSLFYYQPQPQKCKAKRLKYYCTCEELCCGKRVVKCDYTGYSSRPKYVTKLGHWKNLNFPGGKHCGKRKRRSVETGIDLPDDAKELRIYNYSPEPVNSTSPTWPTSSGKTEAFTRKYCEDQIENSPTGRVCNGLLDFTPFIEQCVEDIQITDNTSFANSAISTMQSACEELSLKNLTMWRPNEAKNNTLEPPVEIGGTLCPNLCSGNGNCSNSTCICNDGFMGDDCSVRTDEAPMIDRIPMKGLCDVRKRDCRRTRIVGSNFLDNENLTCRAQEVFISNRPYKKTGQMKLSQGKLLSFMEIMCEFASLPLQMTARSSEKEGRPSGGLLIDVTNDKVLYSTQKVLYVIYDSKCMSCDGSAHGICVKKPDSCLINGYCYSKYERDPVDVCLLCDPSQNDNKLSKDQGASPPVFNMSASFTAFSKQPFAIQLIAYDPKGLPLTYILAKTYEGVVLSAQGLFKWTPPDTKAKTFEVKAVDKCDSETTHIFTVEVLNCTICKRGQICKIKQFPISPNSTYYEDRVVCVCPEGCTGAECQESKVGQECINTQHEKTVAEDSKKTVTVVFSALGAVIMACLVAMGVLIAMKNRQRMQLARGMAKPGPVRDAKAVDNVYDDIEEDSYDNFSYSLEKLQKQ